MGKIAKYDADPVYSIQAKLDEYVDILGNIDFDIEIDDETKGIILGLEDDLNEIITNYFPNHEDMFEDFIESIHCAIKRNELDFYFIEENSISISNAVKKAGSRRDNWVRMDNFVERDEHETADVIKEALRGNFRYNSEEFNLKNQDIFDRFSDIRIKANEIYNYIISKPKPVSKAVLASVIPGYSDRALAIAVSRNDILNYRGIYFYIKHIELSDKDLEYITRYMLKAVCSTSVIHVDDLYDDFVDNFPRTVARAFIQHPYHLFSFLECYLRKQLKFSRPYIALPGAYIATPQEYLYTYISKRDEIAVGEFVDYAKSKRIQVNSILELICSLNDQVILKDRETIVPIKNTGINQKIAWEIIALIEEELSRTRYAAIRDLACIVKFPKIKVAWNEWLIYSVIRKWAVNIEVRTTSKIFRQSIPIVTIPGEVTEEAIADIATRCSDLSYTQENKIIESLDDIDDMILGFIDLDLDWEDE